MESKTTILGKILRILRKAPDSNLVIGLLFSGAVGITTAAILVDTQRGNHNDLPEWMTPFHGRYIEGVRFQDVGQIPAGGSAPFSFEVRNISKSTVRLETGPASCACLVSGVSKDTVKPGESATIGGTIGGGFPGRTKMVNFLVYASPAGTSTAHSKAASRETIPFVVSGRVPTDRGPNPGQIEIKLAPQATQIIRRPFAVVWDVAEHEELELESTANLPPGVSIELMPARQQENGAKEFAGVVVLDPAKLDSDAMHFYGSAIFKLKSLTTSRSPLFTVPIVCDVLNGILVRPDIVCWSKSDQASPITVRVVVADGVDFAITNLNFDASLVDCNIDRSRSTIVVACRALGRTEALRSTLQIDLTFGSEKKEMAVTVPILIL